MRGNVDNSGRNSFAPGRADSGGGSTGAREASSTERGLDDPILRAAIENVERHVAALSASEVVQLVMYPESLAAWAGGMGVDDSQVANLFRRHRRYSLRTLLATRVGMPISCRSSDRAVVAVPAAKRPPGYEAVLTQAGLGQWGKRPAIDWGRRRTRCIGTAPTRSSAWRWWYCRWPRRPCRRPGSSGTRLAEEPRAFAARAQRFTLDQLLTTLSGLRRSDSIETSLARRLRVTHRTLDTFIRAEKRDPVADLSAPAGR